jgi:hypothetical protein
VKSDDKSGSGIQRRTGFIPLSAFHIRALALFIRRSAASPRFVLPIEHSRRYSRMVRLSSNCELSAGQ